MPYQLALLWPRDRLGGDSPGASEEPLNPGIDRVTVKLSRREMPVSGVSPTVKSG